MMVVVHDNILLQQDAMNITRHLLAWDILSIGSLSIVCIVARIEQRSFGAELQQLIIDRLP